MDEVNKVTISFEEDMIYTATLATLMNMLDEGNPQMAYDSIVNMLPMAVTFEIENEEIISIEV